MSAPLSARDHVMVTAMQVMEREAAKVRAAGTLTWGEQQRFAAMLPRKTPEELLDDPSPYVWGYAEALRDFIAALEAAPKAPFVEKRKGGKP